MNVTCVAAASCSIVPQFVYLPSLSWRTPLRGVALASPCAQATVILEHPPLPPHLYAFSTAHRTNLAGPERLTLCRGLVAVARGLMYHGMEPRQKALRRAWLLDHRLRTRSAVRTHPVFLNQSPYQSQAGRHRTLSRPQQQAAAARRSVRPSSCRICCGCVRPQSGSGCFLLSLDL